MSNTLSPNMSLIIPTVGQELGPDWALDINSSLSTLDQHNHASGNGVQITPTGLNINSDLPFLGNNAISLRSVRFSPQGSPLGTPSDLGCLYESGVDLYYNDGNGVQIRLTSSGSPAGTPGSIANLVSPASVTYVSATPAFVFESAANTPANLDGGSVTIRDIVANSAGITLNAPPFLAADYDVTFPSSLPSAQSFLTLDNSGNLATPILFTGGITSSNLASNLTFTGNTEVTGDLKVDGNNFTLGPNSVTLSTVSLPNAGNIYSFPGGIAPQSGQTVVLVGRTSNTIDIFASASGPVGSTTTHPIVVSANPNTSGLMIVRGGVSSSGSLIRGEGFGVVRTGLGSYTVTFNQAFVDAPAVVLTCDSIGGAFPNVYIANTAGINVGGFLVIVKDPSEIYQDVDFSFIAIGQRLN